MKTSKYNLNQVYTNGLYDKRVFFQQQGLNAVIGIIDGEGVMSIVPGAFFQIHGLDRQVIVSDEDLVNIIANYPKKTVEIVKKRSVRGKQSLPNPLEVVRFIRPLNWDNHNLYGVTLVFNLDYNRRKIDVGISICNGDNFEKSDGINRAKTGKMYIAGLDMPADIWNCASKDGLIAWFMERAVVENEHNPSVAFNINWKSIELMIDMYAASK